MTMDRNLGRTQRITDYAYIRSLGINTGMPNPRAATPPPTKTAGASNAAGRDRQPLDLYFALTFPDESEGDGPSVDSDAEGNPRAHAPAGRTYHVEVRVVRTHIGGDLPLTLGDDEVYLELALVSGQHSCVRLTANTCRLSYDDAYEFTHTFEVIVDANCPSLTLKLECRPVIPGRRLPLAKCAIDVDGVPSPTPEHLDAVGLDPTFRYPDEVASLSIEEEAKGSYRITGFNTPFPPPWKELRYTAQEIPAFIEMAEFVATFDESLGKSFSEMSVKEIDGSVTIGVRHNDAMFRLRAWLKSLLALHGEQLIIIITDHAGTNFPWEILSLGSGEYLGAQATVVRWIPANTDTDTGRLKIRVHPEQCHGAGLTFVDESLGSAPAEQEAFIRAGATPIPTMAQLTQRLEDAVDDIAVIHLASHGTFTYSADNLSDTRKASLTTSDKTQRLSVLELETIPVHSSVRPLFIVNACHSARLRKDGDGLYGLAEVVLTRCADAYIGTLGPVNTHYANYVGSHLAQMLGAGGGLHAARFLRDWRARAAAEYLRHKYDPDPTHYEGKFVYAFMYIYYGNPYALWSLNQRTLTEPEPEQEAV